MLTKNDKKKGIIKIGLSLVPILFIVLMIAGSDPSWWAMVWAVLLAVFSIPCLILFISGLVNIISSPNKKDIIYPNRYIHWLWKIVSWFILFVFSPTFFFDLDLAFRPLFKVFTFFIALYVLFFAKNFSKYKLIMLIIFQIWVVLFIYPGWLLR